MSIAKTLLTIYRGDTHSIEITVTDADGDAYNLTGYTATFTAKAGTTELISVEKVCTTAPSTGVETIVLSSEDTEITPRTCEYDIQIANTDSPPIVYTIARGRLKILKDITT